MGQLIGGLLGGALGGLIPGQAQHPFHNRTAWDALMPPHYRHVSDFREHDLARAQDMAFEEAGIREVNEIAPSDA